MPTVMPFDKENLEDWEKILKNAGKNGDIMAATTRYFYYLHEHHQPYGNLAYRAVGDKKKFESQLAHNIFQEMAHKHQVEITEAKQIELMFPLVLADVQLRINAPSHAITLDQVLDYHKEIYEKEAKLPKKAWTESPFNSPIGISFWLLEDGPGNPHQKEFTQGISAPGSEAHRQFAQLASRLLNEGTFQKTIRQMPLEAAKFAFKTFRNSESPGLLATVTGQTLLRDACEECLETIQEQGGIDILPNTKKILEQFAEGATSLRLPLPHKASKLLPLQAVLELYTESSHAKCHKLAAYNAVLRRPFSLNLAAEAEQAQQNLFPDQPMHPAARTFIDQLVSHKAADRPLLAEDQVHFLNDPITKKYWREKLGLKLPLQADDTASNPLIAKMQADYEQAMNWRDSLFPRTESLQSSIQKMLEELNQPVDDTQSSVQNEAFLQSKRADDQKTDFEKAFIFDEQPLLGQFLTQDSFFGRSEGEDQDKPVEAWWLTSPEQPEFNLEALLGPRIFNEIYGASKLEESEQSMPLLDSDGKLLLDLDEMSAQAHHPDPIEVAPQQHFQPAPPPPQPQPVFHVGGGGGWHPGRGFQGNFRIGVGFRF